MKGPLPRIGIHVSIAGKLSEAVSRAVGMGCETMQIFESSPRMWKSSPLDPEQVRLFREKREEAGIRPLVVHASYLINVSSFKEELWEKSVAAGAESLQRCRALGADFFVMHVVSPAEPRGEEEVIERIGEALRRLNKEAGEVRILLENTAGTGSGLGSKFRGIGRIMERSGVEPGFCLDTAHAFGAGYALHEPAGLKEALREIDEGIGLEKLAVVHANDSRAELGSNRDRHAAIGEGLIGEKGFKALLADRELRKRPFILETPGDDEADAANVARMKDLRASLPA